MKLSFLTISTACLTSLLTHAYAADYYSSPASMPMSGYSSSGSNPSNVTQPYPSSSSHPIYEHRNNHAYLSVNVNTHNSPTYFTDRSHHTRFREPQWITMWKGNAIPTRAVVGGQDALSQRTLFVCRAEYGGGLHPGKLAGGRCHISWGGEEIAASRYEILVSRSQLGWAVVNSGLIPANAIQAGHENGRTLYACQADYQGGMYPGKVVSNTCHIAWNGRELALPYYNVLIR